MVNLDIFRCSQALQNDSDDSSDEIKGQLVKFKPPHLIPFLSTCTLTPGDSKCQVSCNEIELLFCVSFSVKVCHSTNSFM